MLWGVWALFSIKLEIKCLKSILKYPLFIGLLQQMVLAKVHPKTLMGHCWKLYEELLDDPKVNYNFMIIKTLSVFFNSPTYDPLLPTLCRHYLCKNVCHVDLTPISSGYTQIINIICYWQFRQRSYNYGAEQQKIQSTRWVLLHDTVRE